MTIRNIEKKDLPKIMELIEEYFAYTEMSEDDILQRMKSPQYFYQKSTEKNAFAGYAEWEIIHAKKGIVRLNGICVLPEFKRRGHGTKLLLAGEEKAREKGMKKICLFVGEINENAKKMYEKNGYAFIRKHDRTIDRKPAEVWEKKL
ncbi:MAG: GNAT family N-acetyltransferase [archaeon]|mgnify:FL=1